VAKTLVLPRAPVACLRCSSRAPFSLNASEEIFPQFQLWRNPASALQHFRGTRWGGGRAVGALGDFHLMLVSVSSVAVGRPVFPPRMHMTAAGTPSQLERIKDSTFNSDVL
jgi:hypothetical protein